MSKQVKLKIKKSLKKAEFVHADLEYHEELISDAKREFFAEVEEVFDKLSPEDKKKINDVKKKKMAEQSKREAIERSEEEEDEEIGGLPDNEDMLSTDDNSEEEPEGPGATGIKSSDLKKLFHAIADICHPDKTEARGAGELEIIKLERVFKEAQAAYKGEHWYILYVIALDLGIDVEDPTRNHVEWVEEDIRYTLEKISQIETLIVWVWYSGNGPTKLMAMQEYFQQSFGFDLRT